MTLVAAIGLYWQLGAAAFLLAFGPAIIRAWLELFAILAAYRFHRERYIRSEAWRRAVKR